MTRYCLGASCRDLTPIPAGRQYCDQCYGAALRARHREESKRHMLKPDKRAAKLASNRRWWAKVGADKRKKARAAA